MSLTTVIVGPAVRVDGGGSSDTGRRSGACSPASADREMIGHHYKAVNDNIAPNKTAIMTMVMLVRRIEPQ